MPGLIAILKDVRPDAEFSNSSDFIADGLLDSYDVLVLVQRIEESYGISIDGADVTPENFRNVGTLRSLVSRYTHEQDV